MRSGCPVGLGSFRFQLDQFRRVDYCCFSLFLFSDVVSPPFCVGACRMKYNILHHRFPGISPCGISVWVGACIWCVMYTCVCVCRLVCVGACQCGVCMVYVCRPIRVCVCVCVCVFAKGQRETVANKLFYSLARTGVDKLTRPSLQPHPAPRRRR